MIAIEFAYFDTASNENEVKEIFNQVGKYKINTISILPFYIKLIKGIIDNTTIASPIDYPCGILDTKSRVSATEFAIKSGAQIVDIVVPSHYLSNRKYDKFRDDIKNIKAITDHYQVSLRYILEYRVYSYDLLYRICQILLDFNINTVLPSTGFGLDDIADNIIAAALINKKLPNLNIICNGNIWNNKHIDLIEKAKLPAIRLNSVSSLELIHKKFNTF
jgi:deoxyribose-phosphate aldolase